MSTTVAEGSTVGRSSGHGRTLVRKKNELVDARGACKQTNTFEI